MLLPKKILEEKVRKLLEEDLGMGDVTTALTIPATTIVEAEIIAKEAGIIAGIEEVLALLESLDLQTTILAIDGSKIGKRTTIMKISGNARTLLSIERTLLNILSRMSGIATKTNRIVNKVQRAGYKGRIASTRKVAPGLSYFDKKAAMLGGADTHRLHLDDLVLIKDNHLAITRDISKTVEEVRNTTSFSKKIEIEVSTKSDALEAAEAGADIIMLDNFSPREIKETMTLLRKKGLREKVLIEASGGINEENILEFADTGVDIISLGEITDSVEALDTNLEIVKVLRK